MAWIRFSTVLSEEIETGYRNDSADLGELIDDVSKRVFDTPAGPDRDALLAQQGWHISCWYVYDGGGYIQLYGIDDSQGEGLTKAEAERIVRERDWMSIRGYDICDNRWCQSALRNAIACYAAGDGHCDEWRGLMPCYAADV